MNDNWKVNGDSATCSSEICDTDVVLFDNHCLKVVIVNDGGRAADYIPVHVLIELMQNAGYTVTR